MMKKVLICLFLAMVFYFQTYAAAITLDFSSGAYNGSNTVYNEDGFRVEASHGFNSIHLGTLAWYEGDNVITISSGGNLFNLDHLTIVDSAFAGLTFKSSNGGLISVGSISGPLDFQGEKWDSISYFTITTITHFDILNEIDNVALTTVTAIPEPMSALLFLSGLVLLWLRMAKAGRLNWPNIQNHHLDN